MRHKLLDLWYKYSFPHYICVGITEGRNLQTTGYNSNNNNVRSSIRNIGCLQIFSSLLGS
jgi:hypothetical protein